MAAAEFPASVAESALRDRLILDRATTEELGRVGGFWIDFQARRVLGIVCQSGFMGRSKRNHDRNIWMRCCNDLFQPVLRLPRQ